MMMQQVFTFLLQCSIASTFLLSPPTTFSINPTTNPIENDGTKDHRMKAIQMAVDNNNDNNDNDVIRDTAMTTNRRDFGSTILYRTASTISILNSLLFPEICMASDSNKSNKKGLLSIEQVAKKLHTIPTFTIVDPSGVPYMVFGEDAKLTAYFFLTYPEANRILQLARDSSTTWKEARISSVPLDFALTLETKSTKGSYFVVSPADEDLEEATSIEPKFESLEDGRNIPLFYFEHFYSMDDTIFPMYFRKSELVQAWKDVYPTLPYPKVRVTEFVATVTDMLSPPSKKETSNSGLRTKELGMISFEYPLDSLEYANTCDLEGKGKEAFKLGERIVVL